MTRLFCVHTQGYLTVINCLAEIKNSTSTPVDCHRCLKGEIKWEPEPNIPIYSKPEESRSRDSRISGGTNAYV